MKSLADISIFKWIAEGRQPLPPAYSPVPLSCLMPLKFERYTKILHSFSTSHDKIEPSLTAEELAILQIPNCLSVKRLAASRPIGARILWKEAARALQLPYSQEITHAWFSKSLAPNPQCWPRFIEGPADGVLEIKESRELASILEAFTLEQACYFRLPEQPFIGSDGSLLFEGLLEEAPEFFAKYQYGPEYWWPKNHQWCACSDYDLTFTIVGGPAELVSRLLKSGVLECIEVDPTIRVDSLVVP